MPQSEAEAIQAAWSDAGGADYVAQGGDAPISGVTYPSAWLTEALGGQTSSGSVRVDWWAALQAVPIAAAVKILAEDIAKLPIRLWRFRADGGRDEVFTHPVIRLLGEAPNPWMTPFTFKAALVAQYALNGNAIAIVERDQAMRPTRIVPMETPRVALWIADGELWYYVSFSNDLHRAEFDSYGALFPAADVIHVKWPISWYGLWGYSPILMGREAVANMIVLDRYTGSLYANFCDIGGVLTTEKRLNEEGLAKLRRQWESRYSGSANRGRTAILEDGLKFDKMSMTAEDAQFIVNRKFSTEEACRMYRIPPYKMADLTRTIQSNITEQSQSYADDTLVPIITNFEEEYEAKLLIALEPRRLDIEHDLSKFLRGRPQDRWSIYKEAIGCAALTPNEARLLEGMNPYDGGNQYYRSVNLVPYDEKSSQAAGPTPPSDPKLEQQKIEQQQKKQQLTGEALSVLRAIAERAERRRLKLAPLNGHG